MVLYIGSRAEKEGGIVMHIELIHQYEAITIKFEQGTPDPPQEPQQPKQPKRQQIQQPSQKPQKPKQPKRPDTKQPTKDKL